jgi:sugar transferase (PEP-CTERM system associated)
MMPVAASNRGGGLASNGVRIFEQHVPVRLALVAVFDAVATTGSYYLANALLPERTFDLVASEGWLLHLQAVLFMAFVLTFQAGLGLYSSQQRVQIEGVLVRTIAGLAGSAIGLGLFAFLFEMFRSRAEWLLAFGICVVVLSVLRVVERNFLDEDIFRRRVLVYGAGKRASSILQLRRRSDQRGFRLVAFLPDEGDTDVIDDARVLREHVPSLLEFARRERVTEVVVAVDDRRHRLRIDELLQCKMSGVRVIDLLGFLERESGRVKVDLLNPSWLIFAEHFSSMVGKSQIGFRSLDLLGAILLLPLLLPLMALIALAILVDDGAPVLYRQRRVGLLGKEFTLYKFRSMRRDAESSGGPRWAEKGDARATRVGKWLRKMRLDELPQLVNVILGSMSFVGPRPERPEFVAELSRKIPYYAERHYVKPGITGWAQLRYPYGASEKDALAKLEFDLYYVKNRSIIFNLIIVLQTLEVVLWQKGSR